MSISREKEAHYYWRTMRQIRLLERARMAFPDDAEDLQAELEVIAKWTEWPALRRICLATLASVVAPPEALAESSA